MTPPLPSGQRREEAFADTRPEATARVVSHVRRVGDGRAAGDLLHPRPVGRSDEADQRDIVSGDGREPRDGRAAGPVERRQKASLGLHRPLGGLVVEPLAGGDHPVVVAADLHRDRPLRAGREEDGRVEDLGRDIGDAEPVEARQREERPIAHPRLEFLEAGLHVAAQDIAFEVRPGAAHQRLTPQRGSADGGPGRQVGEAHAAAADEDVAHILTREEGAEGEVGGQDRLEVLGGVDGAVDPTLLKCGLDLLGKETLAADLGQRPVEDLVAGGLDHDDLARRALTC